MQQSCQRHGYSHDSHDERATSGESLSVAGLRAQRVANNLLRDDYDDSCVPVISSGPWNATQTQASLKTSRRARFAGNLRNMPEMNGKGGWGPLSPDYFAF